MKPTLLHPRRNRPVRRAVRQGEDSEGVKICMWSVGYGFLWVLFIGAIVYGMLFSSLLKVRTIDIGPTKAVSRLRIETAVSEFLSGRFGGIFPKDGLFLAFLRRNALGRELESQFPLIRDSDISVRFPDAVVVSLKERQILFVACSGGPCFFVDELGVPFLAARPEYEYAASGQVVVVDESAKPITIGESNFSKEFLETLHSIRTELQGALDIDTSEIVLTPFRLSNDIRIPTKEGWRIFLSADIPVERAVHSLGLFLSKMLSKEDRERLDYVDLRTENRIFYLLRGESEREGAEISGNAAKDAKEKKPNE